LMACMVYGVWLENDMSTRPIRETGSKGGAGDRK